MDPDGRPVNKDIIEGDGHPGIPAKKDIKIFWKQLGAELNPNAMSL